MVVLFAEEIQAGCNYLILIRFLFAGNLPQVGHGACGIAIVGVCGRRVGCVVWINRLI